MPEFRHGDRVKVTLEGEVRDILTHGKVVVHYDAEYLFVHDSESAHIEKVEPPVVVFQPGDLVRNKRHGYPYLITKEGYVELHPPIAGEVVTTGHGRFTSKDYEKVDIG